MRTAEQAQDCAARRFDLARRTADSLAAEQFTAAPADAEGLRRQFGEADRDDDGRISREEWMAWFGPAYAATRPTGGAQHATD